MARKFDNSQAIASKRFTPPRVGNSSGAGQKATPGAGLAFGVGERWSCKWETIFGF